jgi:hypothetical protein
VAGTRESLPIACVARAESYALTLDPQELMVEGGAPGMRGLAYVWDYRVSAHLASVALVRCLDDGCAFDDSLFLSSPPCRPTSTGQDFAEGARPGVSVCPVIRQSDPWPLFQNTTPRQFGKNNISGNLALASVVLLAHPMHQGARPKS